MPDFNIVDVTETPYLYAEGTCSMDPKDISDAMGEVYHQVTDFMGRAGITPTGPALSVYTEYDPERMRFRAGFVIAHEDMAKANDTVMASVTPAGRALHFVHQGSYATLRDDYALMMDYMVENKIEMGSPSWEIYLNEPDKTAESDLRTGCYMALN